MGHASDASWNLHEELTRAFEKWGTVSIRLVGKGGYYYRTVLEVHGKVEWVVLFAETFGGRIEKRVGGTPYWWISGVEGKEAAKMMLQWASDTWLRRKLELFVMMRESIDVTGRRERKARGTRPSSSRRGRPTAVTKAILEERRRLAYEFSVLERTEREAKQQEGVEKGEHLASELKEDL